jgi:hypothetical protein
VGISARGKVRVVLLWPMHFRLGHIAPKWPNALSHHCESFMQLKLLPWGAVEGGQGGAAAATGDMEFKGGVTIRA